MTQFTLPEILKQHVELADIYDWSFNTNYSNESIWGQYLYTDLRLTPKTMQNLWKELDESNGDYEGTAAWKSHSDRPDKKRTPEFVAEIQAMIDNDSFKAYPRMEYLGTWSLFQLLSGCRIRVGQPIEFTKWPLVLSHEVVSSSFLSRSKQNADYAAHPGSLISSQVTGGVTSLSWTHHPCWHFWLRYTQWQCAYHLIVILV